MAQNRSAWDVYKMGCSGQYGGQHRRFFKDLQQAICRDYAKKGNCTYIEQKINRRGTRTMLIEFSVLQDLEGYYCNGGRLSDPEREWYIPHVFNSVQGFVSVRKEYFSWNDGMKLVPEKATEHIIRLASNIQTAAHRQWEENQRQLPTGAADSALEQAREQARQILNNAQAEANRIRADAERDKQKVMDAWAHVQAREAEIAEKQAELKHRSAQAEEAAKEQANRMIAQYLRDYQSQLRTRWDRQLEEEARQEERAVEGINNMKEAMCRTTNDLKVTWRNKLEETIEEMKQMQTELDMKLRSWQVALYPREFRAIADCYVQLYRILTQDQLLTREIVAREADGPQERAAYHPETMETLKQLNLSLTTFLKKFEKAMNKLGLYVFVPEAGEPYDDVLHIPFDSTIEDPDSMVVSRCEVPGVMRQTSEELEDGEPVIRATVKLKAQEVC